MIIADTNVVSEFMRDDPDENVLAWAGRLGPGELSVCVVTVTEIERGLARLPEGRRRAELGERWAALLEEYTQFIAVYDVPAARTTADILVDADRRGRPIRLADAQIAGMCVARDLQLATRNVRDFEGIRGLVLVNPFSRHT